jgi:hypothetical protein
MSVSTLVRFAQSSLVSSGESITAALVEFLFAKGALLIKNMSVDIKTQELEFASIVPQLDLKDRLSSKAKTYLYQQLILSLHPLGESE